jgi:hypothetical protein
MKAKEWAAKLSESPDSRDETLKAFVEEIGTVAQQRGGSVSAVEGAVREQRSKWQAVCREDPSVAPGLFESLLETYGPDYKKAEEAAKAQAARGAEERPGGARPGRRPGPKGKKGGRPGRR